MDENLKFEKTEFSFQQEKQLKCDLQFGNLKFKQLVTYISRKCFKLGRKM